MKKIKKFFALQVNGLFPFLYPLRHVVSEFRFLRGPIQYLLDIRTYKKKSSLKNDFPIHILDTYPRLYDRYEEAGEVPHHYFYQDIWAAKKVFASGVKEHHDIGSRLDGFIAHCLIFCDVTMLDVRPLPQKIPRLSFTQTNAMDMKNIQSQSIASISSLHAMEHFGLGRYNDPIDPEGYKKAIAEIQRVTAPLGNIYFSVPIGKERLEFNAHRIFSSKTILRLFDHCQLIEFSAINDRNEFIEPAHMEDFLLAEYSCGLFHFQKRSL